MAIIEWTDSYSVNIESIDYQHKRLFELINNFYEELYQNRNQKNIIKLIFGLRDYTLLHFNKEEQLMKKYNFPDIDNHKKEHVIFIKAVEDYISRISTGKLIISLEITNFIKDWISNHIAVKDMEYSKFFIEKGVI